jgi:FkbH-like protein
MGAVFTEAKPSMLNWLPSPRDFSARLRDAFAVSGDECTERLAALAQHRLAYLQEIQLSRALDRAAARWPVCLRRVRLALLGSVTVEHLLPAIRVAALRRRLWIDGYIGAYGQYRRELLEGTSALWKFSPDVTLFSLSASQLIPKVESDASQEESQLIIMGIVNDLQTLWHRARVDLRSAVIQQTFLNIELPLFGNLDRLIPASPWRLVERLNDAVSSAASIEGVPILDVARASQRDGQAVWFDEACMLLAKQEIAPSAASLYAEHLARIVAAQQGLSKKCLVLDLDDTLWGGVLGDDGIEGLTLGQGSAIGEAHLAVQRYAKQLRERGIILAVCSKNDPSLAAEAFDKHPEMLLKRADIACFVANWEDKVCNLKSIARQLNIGVDSLVLLDDNPAERARVREALPGVGVPELPADVAGYVVALAEAGYFEAVSVTDDDRRRAVHYSENAEREALRSNAQSIDAFLKGLEMSVEVDQFTPMELGRVTQLISKTNQFTTTTRRYTADEIERYAKSAGALTCRFRLRDRFGDNGIVSALIMLPTPDCPHHLEIDTWVMSCRVFGRQLEHEALNIAVEKARGRGVTEIFASYLPTPKNAVIRDLYPSLGFEPIESLAEAPRASRWRLRVADYKPWTTHISRDTSNS